MRATERDVRAIVHGEDLDGHIEALVAELETSRDAGPFAAAAERTFDVAPGIVSAWLDEAGSSLVAAGFPDGMIHVEMNGFAANPERWFASIEAMERPAILDGELDDASWSGVHSVQPGLLDLTGMEPMQAAFERFLGAEPDEMPSEATIELAARLVHARFIRLIQHALAEVPLRSGVEVAASSHDGGPTGHFAADGTVIHRERPPQVEFVPDPVDRQPAPAEYYLVEQRGPTGFAVAHGPAAETVARSVAAVLAFDEGRPDQEDDPPVLTYEPRRPPPAPDVLRALGTPGLLVIEELWRVLSGAAGASQLVSAPVDVDADGERRRYHVVALRPSLIRVPRSSERAIPRGVWPFMRRTVEHFGVVAVDHWGAGNLGLVDAATASRISSTASSLELVPVHLLDDHERQSQLAREARGALDVGDVTSALALTWDATEELIAGLATALGAPDARGLDWRDALDVLVANRAALHPYRGGGQDAVARLSGFRQALVTLAASTGSDDEGLRVGWPSTAALLDSILDRHLDLRWFYGSRLPES